MYAAPGLHTSVIREKSAFPSLRADGSAHLQGAGPVLGAVGTARGAASPGHGDGVGSCADAGNVVRRDDTVVSENEDG